MQAKLDGVEKPYDPKDGPPDSWLEKFNKRTAQSTFEQDVEKFIENELFNTK